MKVRLAGVLLTMGLVLTPAQAKAQITARDLDSDSQTAMIKAVTAAEAQAAPPPEVNQVVFTPTPVPIVNPFIDYWAVTKMYLRTLPPRTLMEVVMGPGMSAKMNYVIQRESGWNCGSNNRHSSAAGLGQTVKTQGRVDYLSSLGFTWEDVRGPDCVADMYLIKQLYDSCGMGPWTPPSYGCRRP